MNKEKKSFSEDPPPSSPSQDILPEDALSETDKESGNEDTTEGVEEKNSEVDEKTALLKKIEAQETEIEDYKNRYYRALADMENFRKRSVREKESLRKFGPINLVEALLPAFDNLQLGLSTAQQHPEAQSITQGFALVADQLKSTLNQNGIKEINPVSEVFDPNLHECVSHQSHETIEEGKVISVIRSGYLIHDRLVRPASVIVSSGAGQQAASEQENQPCDAEGNVATINDTTKE